MPVCCDSVTGTQTAHHFFLVSVVNILKATYLCSARAYSSSCSAAVSAGVLRSSLHSRGEAFTSALQACSLPASIAISFLAIIWNQGRQLLLARTATSNCSCNQAHRVAAVLLSPAWGAWPPAGPHAPVFPSRLLSLAVRLATLPFEKSRNQSF